MIFVKPCSAQLKVNKSQKDQNKFFRIKVQIWNFTGFAHSGCPGCPIEGNLENEPQADKIKETASQSAVVLLKTKFAGGELNQDCNVNLVSVSNFKNQVNTYFYGR